MNSLIVWLNSANFPSKDGGSNQNTKPNKKLFNNLLMMILFGIIYDFSWTQTCDFYNGLMTFFKNLRNTNLRIFLHAIYMCWLDQTTNLQTLFSLIFLSWKKKSSWTKMFFDSQKIISNIGENRIVRFVVWSNELVNLFLFFQMIKLKKKKSVQAP
jgi:hypothetical protein